MPTGAAREPIVTEAKGSIWRLLPPPCNNTIAGPVPLG